jgi:hypothetical protein
MLLLLLLLLIAGKSRLATRSMWKSIRARTEKRRGSWRCSLLEHQTHIKRGETHPTGLDLTIRTFPWLQGLRCDPWRPRECMG